LLHLPPVGVEDPVVKIGIGLTGRLHLEDLVATNAEMPVGNVLQLLGPEGQGMGKSVQNDEIIA
jgi:hypothetical protein